MVGEKPNLLTHLSMHRRQAISGMASALLFGPAACRAAPVARVSLFDYLPAAQHRAIANGRSQFDCAPDLERALHETAASNATLFVPCGTYLLEPVHAIAHADPHFECLAAVRMVSGMKLAAEFGTTLKMTPGFSTDDRPRAMAMFATSDALQDISISEAVLDMNGRQNPISPDRGEGVYNRLPQAQIFVSSRRGSPPARVDRIRIANTIFRDANGVSCIVMGQNEDRSARLGRGWTLDGCAFRDNGMDTDDHSSVFAYADDVTVTNCIFANTRPFGTTGVNTAYEVHGSHQRIRRSTFKNMLRGIWVANNYVSSTSGTVIEDNDFHTLFYGIDFFHDRAEARFINNTRIENNRFHFDDQTILNLPRLNFKAAVQIASEFGQQGVFLTGKSVTKVGHEVTSAFLVITGGASGPRRHDDINACGNEGNGLTFGSFVRSTRTAGLGHLAIVNNRWSDLAPSNLMDIAAGDAVERTEVSQPIISLSLGGGSLQNSPALRGQVYGVFINSTIVSFHLAPLTISGIPGAALKMAGNGKIGTYLSASR